LVATLGGRYDPTRMGKRRAVSEARRADGTPSPAPSPPSKYDAAYAAKKDFVARPNAFLARCLTRIADAQRAEAQRARPRPRKSRRRRRALDIGLGQGRNALLLARSGYDTTGIDRSEVGAGAARRMAAARGLRINVVVADTEAYAYGRNRWDLIVLLYYPMPMILIERLKAAVRPGGHIVIERFSRPDRCTNARDQHDTRRRSPMIRSLLDWHVLHYENDELESDWHWNGEAPTGPIVRLLARKPWAREESRRAMNAER